MTSRIGLGYLMEQDSDGEEAISWKNRDRMSNPLMEKAGPLTATDYKEADLVLFPRSSS